MNNRIVILSLWAKQTFKISVSNSCTAVLVSLSNIPMTDNGALLEGFLL